MRSLVAEQRRIVSVPLLIVLAALAVAPASSGALCRTTDALAKENPDLSGWSTPEPLPRYGFLKPGVALFSATCLVASPSVRALFLRSGHLTRRPEVSTDLVGYVQIHTAQEALAYAHLLTSYWVRMTASDPYWREVAIAPAGDTSADRMDAGRRPGEPHERLNGVLRRDEWEANRLSDPTVKQVGKDFVVTRWLWTVDPRKGGYHGATDFAWLVSDQIAPDGRVKETVIGKRRLHGVKIVAPILR